MSDEIKYLDVWMFIFKKAKEALKQGFSEFYYIKWGFERRLKLE